MLARSPIAPESARECTVQSADQTVSDDESLWFSTICKTLLPKDAGLALHITTGIEERSCYRYAAGDRKVPGYLVRTLLRGEGGWQWLSGIMDGCEPDWWREINRARRYADAIRKVDEEPHE